MLSAKLVDVSTSEIVYSDTEIPDYEDDSAMGAASSRMADKLLEVLAGEQAVITEMKKLELGKKYTDRIQRAKSRTEKALVQAKNDRNGETLSPLTAPTDHVGNFLPHSHTPQTA